MFVMYLNNIIYVIIKTKYILQRVYLQQAGTWHHCRRYNEGFCSTHVCNKKGWQVVRIPKEWDSKQQKSFYKAFYINQLVKPILILFRTGHFVAKKRYPSLKIVIELNEVKHSYMKKGLNELIFFI